MQKKNRRLKEAIQRRELEGKLVADCVECLLQAFNEQSMDVEFGEPITNIGIGEIQIIVDTTTGHIDTARIAKYWYERRYKNLFMYVGTTLEACLLEDMLLTWGLDIPTMKDVIVSLEPQYAAPELRKDLEDAAQGIGHVLASSKIMMPGTLSYVWLHEASKRLPLTRDC